MEAVHKVAKKLKNIRLVRIMCRPWMDKKLEAKYQKYLDSGYGERLKELKDSHKGQRCFIIGNGPSLTAEDLTCLKDEYTFSANRIYQMFDKTEWRPWAYVVVDPDLMRTEHKTLLEVPSALKFLPYFLVKDAEAPSAYRIYEAVRTFFVNVGSATNAYIAEDISKGLSRGYTVTFSSIQLAIYMGFKEIYLIGVDFNYSTFVDKNGKLQHQDGVVDYFNKDVKVLSAMNYEPCLHAYKVAKEYCDDHGIVIRNATRGGKLEVFERVDLDKLFTNGGGM